MLSAYLVRMIENHAEDLTREVLDDLTQNPRTPAWHSLSRDEIHRRVYDLYHNLGHWLADNSGARPALPELIELVKSDRCDQRAVHTACRALAEFGVEAGEAAPVIKARLERETQASSRINLAKTLCRIDAGQTNALAELIQYASESMNALRGTTIMSLGNHNMKSR